MWDDTTLQVPGVVYVIDNRPPRGYYTLTITAKSSLASLLSTLSAQTKRNLTFDDPQAYVILYNHDTDSIFSHLSDYNLAQNEQVFPPPLPPRAHAHARTRIDFFSID